jgi:predicted aspartyl protease
MGKVSFGGQDIGIKSVSAAIDTGSSLIALPKEEADIINGKVFVN